MPPPKGADGAPSFAGWPNPDVPVNALIPPPPPPPNPPPESVAGWPNPAPPKGDCAAAGVAVPNMLPEAGGVCIIEAPAAGAAPKGEAAAAGPPPKGLELGAGVLARLPKPNPLCIWLPSHTVRATWDQKPHLKLPRENRCQANMSESKARSKARWLRIGTRRVELEGDRRDRNHTLQPQAVPSRRGSLLNWRPCRSRPSSSVALRPCRIRPSPWRVLRPWCSSMLHWLSCRRQAIRTQPTSCRTDSPTVWYSESLQHRGTCKSVGACNLVGTCNIVGARNIAGACDIVGTE